MDAPARLEKFERMKKKCIASGLVLALLLGLATPGQAEAIVKLVPGETDLTLPRTETDESSVLELQQPRRGESRRSDDSDSSSYEAPALQTRHFGAQAVLSCRLGDQPGELLLVNEGETALPPGTRVRWQLAGLGVRGFFAITGTLDSGETLRAADVVEAEVPAGRGCTARVI